jgi:hypothetical protein
MKSNEECGIFLLLSDLVSDSRYTREIKPRYVIAEAELKKKSSILLDSDFRKKLVKCYRSIPLYSAETWTLRKIDQKYL